MSLFTTMRGHRTESGWLVVVDVEADDAADVVDDVDSTEVSVEAGDEVVEPALALAVVVVVAAGRAGALDVHTPLSLAAGGGGQDRDRGA